MLLSHLVRRAARIAPSGEAAVDGALRVLWPELEGRVARLAAGLLARGAAPGDRIGIVAPNSLAYLELLHAAWWAGLVPAPFNARLDPRGLAVVVADAGPRLLVHAGVPAEHLASVGMRLPPGALLPIGELDGLRAERGIDPVPVRGDDLALLLYTGGTTGDPKGVMLTHENLASNTLNCAHAMGFRTGSRFLHAPPLFHIGAISAATALTAHAGTHVFVSGFDVPRYLDLVARESITDLFLVPTMIGMIARARPADLSGVRSLMYGGSPISPATLAEARATFPRAELRQFYGMTEVTGSGTCLAPEDHADGARLASAGKPLFTVDLRIVDDDGREVPPGARGEIVIRSPGVMKGYHGRPDLTAEVLRGGAMHTGDVGLRDADGFVYVVDRKKDVIVTGGENVYSAEVDRVLAEHPAVAAVATVAAPDPKWGEAVHAVVVLAAGRGPEVLDELAAHCRARLAPFQCPRGYSLRTDLPLNRAGKIQKHLLREELRRG